MKYLMTFFRTIGIIVLLLFYFLTVTVVALMLVAVDIYKFFNKLFNGRDYDKTESVDAKSTTTESDRG